MDEKPRVLDGLQVTLPQELLWEGSMEDYFQKVIDYPKTVRTAHQRLYDAIAHFGVDRYRRYRDDIVRYRIFDDPFDPDHRLAVYGKNVDVALMKLMNTIRAAAQGLGQEYRMYLLHGPYGTAKSTIAQLFSRAIDDYTKRPEGQVFAPYWIVEPGDDEGMEILGTYTRKFERTRRECPLHEEPLSIFMPEIRAPLLASLSKAAKQEIVVSPSACPMCASFFSRFLRRYNGDWRKVVDEHVRVKRLVLSKSERQGVVVVRPKSEKDQDVSEFLGEHDFSSLGAFGSISDPRTFDFAGYYMAANRGIFYWEEGLKFALSFLYDLLGASQEHVVQPKGFREIDLDEVLLLSTNEPEYVKLKEKDEMQALRDRMIKIDIPYILDLDSEKKVYAKFFTEKHRGGKHLAPHTIGTAALWALLTRVTDTKRTDIDRKGKVRLYNGQIVPGFNEDSVKELMRESDKEGMIGISPRYIHDKLSAAFMGVDTGACVNFFGVLHELKEGLRNHPHIKSSEMRDQYDKLIAVAQEELMGLLKDDLYAAIVGDETAIEELYAKFIDHATATVNKEKVKDLVTGEDVEPDDDFIISVLDRIEITDYEDFCQKIVNAMHRRALQRERDPSVTPFTYKTDERLHKALQLYLFEQEKDKINWESLISRKSIDQEGQRRIDTIKERLIKNMGYCDICSSQVMSHVAGIFKRGERAKKDAKK